MTAEAEAQAKQLDSVTDVIAEQEVDATRAAQALSAGFGGTAKGHTRSAAVSKTASTTPSNNTVAVAPVSYTKADIDFIKHQLEVSDIVAIQTLQLVHAEAVASGQPPLQGEDLMKAALVKLIRSA
jgi:hypothetical protein